MDSAIWAAVIVACGAIIGAVVQALLPPNSLSRLFSRTDKRKSLVDEWDSFWGQSLGDVRKNRETITITSQIGDRIWGKASRVNEPDKAWNIEGRCEGDYIQMLWFPAKEAKDKDFQDYGCYFLKKKANGVYAGFSCSFGKGGEDNLTTDNHEMVRRRPGVENQGKTAGLSDS
jgi:hypothetical protein